MRFVKFIFQCRIASLRARCSFPKNFWYIRQICYISNRSSVKSTAIGRITSPSSWPSSSYGTGWANTNTHSHIDAQHTYADTRSAHYSNCTCILWPAYMRCINILHLQYDTDENKRKKKHRKLRIYTCIYKCNNSTIYNAQCLHVHIWNYVYMMMI